MCLKKRYGNRFPRFRPRKTSRFPRFPLRGSRFPLSRNLRTTLAAHDVLVGIVVVPANVFRAFEHQHLLAARSREMTEARTRRMVIEARIRLEKALRALETAAAMEDDDVR